MVKFQDMNDAQISNSQSNQQNSEDVQVNGEGQTTNSQSNQQNSKDGQANGEGQTTDNQQNSEDSFEKNSIGLLKHMETLLDAVDHKRAEACNISIVPEQLRKSNAEAYMPQVVSIGPVHRATRTNLLYMEEVKWRCMKHLFQRSKLDEATCLRRCSRAMWKLDDIIRASYVDDVKFNRNDLTKIMTLDGCFILELLITGSPEFIEKLKNPSLDASPGVEVIKREEVLSDLMLLENQIPIAVLVSLSRVLFEASVEGVNFTKLIHKCALSILGYNYSCLVSLDSGLFRAFNFVELAHSFIDEEKDDVDNDSRIIDMGREQDGDRKLKLGRCATRLEAAGVTITGVVKKNKHVNAFDLKINFKYGSLEIPQLHITKTTEANWRNFIAWELNRTSLDKHRGSRKSKTSCKFISYAWFIQGLICCVHDVKLLRHRNVILVDEVKGKKNKKIMNDEALLKLFRKMTEGISDEQVEMDPWFTEKIRELNSYNRTVDLATKGGRILWHYFRWFLTWVWYICRNSIRALRRDYIPTGWRLVAVLGAIAALALTAIQTAYAIIGK